MLYNGQKSLDNCRDEDWVAVNLKACHIESTQQEWQYQQNHGEPQMEFPEAANEIIKLGEMNPDDATDPGYDDRTGIMCRLLRSLYELK